MPKKHCCCPTVDYYWQIAKLESWHWVLMIYNQIVTWRAFAILSMFSFLITISNLDVIKKNTSPWALFIILRLQKIASILQFFNTQNTIIDAGSTTVYTFNSFGAKRLFCQYIDILNGWSGVMWVIPHTLLWLQEHHQCIQLMRYQARYWTAKT